ncbi:MAG: hypothetical protein K9N49_06840 [Candidatus Marinimicrobia bacterium]|nr:hypothetical protein [Candidatus Neomarinimicrobiota bacterium]
MTHDSEIEPHPIKTLLGKVLNPIRFFRTKRAIMQGDPVYEYPKDIILKQYMGPWTFNLYETALATMPAIIVLWLLDNTISWSSNNPLLHGIRTKIADDPIWGYVIASIASILGRIRYLQFPLALALASRIVAFCSLLGTGPNKEQRQRSRSMYLYLDGAYGLIAQSLFVLGVSLILWLWFLTAEDQWYAPPYVYWFALFWACAVTGILWQLCITLYMIPHRLFARNPLSSTWSRTPRWQRIASRVRWILYWLLAIPSVFIVMYLTVLLMLTIAVIAGLIWGHLLYWIHQE